MNSSGRSSTVEPPVVVPQSQPLMVAVDDEPLVVAVLNEADERNITPDAPSQAESPSARETPETPLQKRPLWKKLLWYWPASAAGGVWNLLSLTVLLAVVAAIPVVQLVSLGYLLRAAANLSAGQPWRTALPAYSWLDA